MGSRRTFITRALGAAAAAAVPGWVFSFVHPADQAPLRSRFAARSPLLAVTSAGRRFVAAGLRGLVVFSDDAGQSWNQAAVPVSTDLVALSFPTETEGWAVGHGGVILHSTDGGASWTRQLDGRLAAQRAIEYFEQRAADGAEFERLLADERSLAEGGGTEPFLGVHFVDAQVGYAVGTFNRIFRTDDAGRSWTPWMDRTDNPQGLHFNAIAGHGQSVYLAGEQGTVWRLDKATGRFVAVPTGYAGTLFGLLPLSETTLLAFGMRGSLFRSEDAGATWRRIPVAGQAGISDGALLPDGAIVLVTQAGALELSRDGGRTFSAAKAGKPMSYFGVAAGGDGRIVVVGAEGVRTETISGG